MKIETIDDFEAVAACCCLDGYTCPQPTAETEIAHGVGDIYPFRTDATTYYSKLRRSWGDGGEQLWHANPIHASQVGPVPGYHPANTNTPDFQIDFTSSPPLTGGFTDAKEDPIGVGDARSASKSAIFAGLDWPNMGVLETGYPTGSRSPQHWHFDPDPSAGSLAAKLDLHNFKFARFRWIVPNTFEGAFFKITWDVLEEPDGWDDPSPTVFRSFYLEDQTWEFTGPGDPGDPESWKSPWIEIPPPDVGGTRRIVNIRFQCIRSTKLGTLPPDVFGEAISDEEL